MKLSIVTTLYYSAPYLEEFYRRCIQTVREISSDYELILVNDGSPDSSLEVALRLYEKDNHVIVVDLSRNFGHHKAIMTGLGHTQGDLVFLIDCDLEEAPEHLIDFHRELTSHPDVDVVFGVQKQREGGFVRRIAGDLFYRLFNLLSSHRIPKNLSITRLMTRRYVEALLTFTERVYIIGGLWVMAGFAQMPLVIEKKFKGQTAYSLHRRLEYLVYGIITFSNRPLIWIVYLGSLTTISSIIVIVYLLVRYLFLGFGVAGWTSVIMSVWLFGGINIFVLGVIALYVSVIFTETKARPQTIIRAIYTRDNHE